MADDFEDFVGRHLAVLRERGGISQEALAVQLGLDQSQVSKTETGRRRVTVTELFAWLDALGLPIGETVESLRAAWADRTNR